MDDAQRPQNRIQRIRCVAIALLVLPCCLAEAPTEHPVEETPPSISRASLAQANEAPDDWFGVALRTVRGTLCSGAVVLPNLVITAHHCVSAASIFSDCGTTTFGATRNPIEVFVTAGRTADDGGGWVRASRIFTASGAPYCGADFAVVLLEQDLPSATPTLPAIDAVPPGPLFAVGYGSTVAQGAGEGVRRRRDGMRVVCQGGGNPSCNGPDGWPLAANEVLVEEGVCPADSGSGVFVDTAAGREVVAVLSRGYVRGESCGLGVYTTLGGVNAEQLRRAAHAASVARGQVSPLWAGLPMQDDLPRPSSVPSELGVSCAANPDCLSNLCAADPFGEGRCSVACGLSDPCPSGFECRWAGPLQYCFASSSETQPVLETESATSSSGCAVTHASSRARASYALLFICLVAGVMASVRRSS